MPGDGVIRSVLMAQRGNLPRVTVDPDKGYWVRVISEDLLPCLLGNLGPSPLADTEGSLSVFGGSLTYFSYEKTCPLNMFQATVQKNLRNKLTRKHGGVPPFWAACTYK